MKNLIRVPVSFVAIMAIFFVSNFININTVSALAKVNINTADAVALDTIPEVGPATAAKIITYRETIGLFLVIEDIMKVSGIKQATFDKLKDFITVATDSGGGDTGGGTGGGTIATTTDSTGTSTDPISLTDPSGGIISTHYYQAELSNYVEPSLFEVSAGRARLAYTGSALSFEAKSKTSADLKNSTPNSTWSFGDGSGATADKVTHTYKYPGEYNVVLNASLGGINSVARTTVKVLIPNLLLSVLTDGAVQISNRGSNEINLFGWNLFSQNVGYAFPLDTIISAGQTVVFPAEYLKISTIGNNITLNDASAKVVVQANSPPIIADLNNKVISIADWQKFAVEYKSSNQITSVVAKEQIITKEVPNIPLTASVVEAIINDTSSSYGFWSKVFHPFRTIKESFYQ